MAGKAFRNNKTGNKAQTSGTGAAVLVIIIAAFIVLYILFLPPATRQELLEEGAGGTGLASINKTLLLASPGRMDYLPKKEIEHPMPSVNLYSTTRATVLKSLRSIYVKSAWFDKQSANFSFGASDSANTKNVLLSFIVNRHLGRLEVKLNGNSIFNSEIYGLNIDPIKLPNELLKEENVVEMGVSDVGAAFWRTNEYELESVKITGDVTDISTREAKNTFITTSTEKDNLERVFLTFLPDCEQYDVGTLEITLNNHNIFTSVPDCGILRSLEISPYYIISGENTLIFKTAKGAYLVDHINTKSKLKELTYPTFYFEIDTAKYDAIASGSDVFLNLDFADDIEYKKAEVWINGHQDGFDTRDRSISMPITLFVNKGNNVVEIKPKTTLDIVKLEAAIE